MRASTWVLVAIVSGCDCGKPSVVGQSGELVVVLREDGRDVTRAEATYDFGTVVVGESKSLTLTLRNVGSRAVQVDQVVQQGPDAVTVGARPEAPAPFAIALTPAELGTTEELKVPLWFAPTQVRGRFEATVTVGSAEEQVTVTLVAASESRQCEVPEVIDFGAVTVGESLTLDVPLSNPTMNTAEVVAGALSGADLMAFGYQPGSPQGPIPLPAGGSTTLRLRFAPTEERSYRARVSLQGAGSCAPVEVLVKGEGTLETLTWTPSSLDFGFVPPGLTKSLTIEFKNPSRANVELTDLLVTATGFGTAASQFGVQPGAMNPKRFMVNPTGTPSSLTVTCTPTTLGARSASLSFNTPLVRVPSGRLSLTCTGGGPLIRATPMQVAFGRVPAVQGAVRRRKIRLANVGTRPATPDARANLLLGKAAVAPYVEFVPAAGTLASEVTATVDARYVPAVGLEATSGKNEVDLEVAISPASAGLKEGELLVYSNDVATPVLRIPVSATAVEASPCNALVTPGQLDFGLVTSGTKDLVVSIKNQDTAANDLCFVSGLGLEPGTHVGFSLVGSPAMERELLPQETLDVTVRITGPTTQLTSIITATGALTFDLAEPMRRRVPVRGLIGTSCVVATPDVVDFGTVKLGCQSAARTVSLYNTCAAAVLLQGVALQPPVCTGTQPCQEFTVTQSPVIPPAGLTLLQGAAPVAVQLAYRPIDLGRDVGQLTFEVIQNSAAISTTVPLEGTATVDGRQTDAFVQAMQAKADVLFVVDDSCSMGTKLAALSTNFSVFSQYASMANIDYHLALTTTTPIRADCVGQTCTPINSLASEGRFFRDVSRMIPPVMDRTNVGRFAGAVGLLGTTGWGVESGLQTAVLALTPPLITVENAGFLRADASLSVVVVSDAGDQSPLPVSYYLNRLLGVKGAQQRSRFSFNVIGTFGTTTPTCGFDSSADPSRYETVMLATGGVRGEICTPNWATTLEQVGKTALGFRTQFYLNAVPDLSSGRMLEVLINGQPAMGWTYEPMSNSVTFQEASTPTAGQSLTVSYEAACH